MKNTKNRLFFVCLIFVCLLLLKASCVLALDRILVVDLKEAVIRSEAGKNALSKIMGQADGLSSEIKVLASEIEYLRKDMSGGALLFSEQSRRKMKKELREKVRDLKEKQELSLEEVSYSRKKALDKVKREMLVIIRRLAKKKKVLYVKDRSETLYFAYDIDITEQVIATHNYLTKNASPKKP